MCSAHLLEVQVPSRLGPGERAARAVTRGPEGLGHAALGAGEHVAARAHRAADQHGLARQLVVNLQIFSNVLKYFLLRTFSYRYKRVVGREGAG